MKAWHIYNICIVSQQDFPCCPLASTQPFFEHNLLSSSPTGLTLIILVVQTKNLMKQLLEGMEYLHSNWVLHRDLKTSNILYNNQGQLKICDFGLARQYGSPLRSYTNNVVTLYYRAIELLLGAAPFPPFSLLIVCVREPFCLQKALHNWHS